MSARFPEHDRHGSIHSAERGDPLRTPMDKAIDNEDRLWAGDRHQRRKQLMRMQGDTNRMEMRMYVCYAIAGVLAILALVLGAMS